ncbi:MAG: helix-turn-helix transcriptional regulator [Acidobacteriota bacterium]
MARGDVVSRSWQLMQLLDSPRGRTIEELHEKLGCSRRTVMRDLLGLQKAGIPIFDERHGREKRWKFVEGFKNRIPPPFSLAELMALYFARSLCRPLSGTPLTDSLERAFKKISSLLPVESIQFLERLDGVIAFRPGHFKDYRQHHELVETITRARLERKSLDVVYRSFSRRQVTRRRIDPYQVCYFQGGLYVIAYDHLRGDVRIFALERFGQIDWTDEEFEVPDGFDFDAYMQSALGIFRGPTIAVRIRFSPSLAPFIRERKWHASQRIESRPGGAVVLGMRVADSLELRRWVLSFGAEAEVLAPPSLRREIREEAKALSEQLERWDIAPAQLSLPMLDKFLTP